MAADSMLQLVTGPSVAFGVETTPAPSAVQQVRDQLPKLSDWLRTAPNVVTGASVIQTQFCLFSGTRLVTVDDRNGNRAFDTGDSGVIEYKNCNDGGGTVNGTMSMAVNALTGDLDTKVYSADFNAVFTNYQVKGSAESVIMNGASRVFLESTAEAVTKTRFSTDSFKMNGTRGPSDFARVFTSFESMHVRMLDSASRYSETATISGSLNSTYLNSLTVQTTTVSPLITSPSGLVSGELRITGAANTTVRVTADAAGKAAIALDTNGDGVSEATKTASWPLTRP